MPSEDSNTLRGLQKNLNELSKLVKEKEKIIDVTPELGVVEQYKESNYEVTVNNDMEDLAERLAALQFSSKTKEEIISLLDISKEKYKEILLSQEYELVRKRFIEDKRTNLMAKIFDKYDAAIFTLSELMETADEDKVKMNSAALILEVGRELMAEEKASNPNGIAGILKDASESGNDVTLNLAQIIMKNRNERGLS